MERFGGWSCMCWNLCSDVLLYPVNCLSRISLAQNTGLLMERTRPSSCDRSLIACLCLRTLAFDCSEAVQVALSVLQVCCVIICDYCTEWMPNLIVIQLPYTPNHQQTIDNVVSLIQRLLQVKVDNKKSMLIIMLDYCKGRYSRNRVSLDHSMVHSPHQLVGYAWGLRPWYYQVCYQLEQESK